MKIDAQPLWDWMNERHRIWVRRNAGHKWPWTEDPILREYKFTNVFREYDAVTLELHKRVDEMATSRRSRAEPWDRMFHIILFRAFNWPATYDELEEAGAISRIDSWIWDHKRALNRLKLMSDRGQKIFTGAYIITNAGSSQPKIRLMRDAMTKIWRDRKKIWERIEDDRTMRGATRILMEYPMMGDFTSYEVVCDLRHQSGLGLDRPSDVMTWANLGPGARRGINRLVNGGPKKPNAFRRTEDYVSFMAQLCEMAPRRLKKSTFYDAPPIECREIEHSLCEFDKYQRVRRGEGRPRSKYTPPGERHD